LDYTNNKTIFYLAVYQFDITSANLVWRIGSGGSDNYVSMSYSHTNGSFDYWKVELTRQTQSDIRYVFQINDGSDTDWGGVNGGGTNSVFHDNQHGDYTKDVWIFDYTPLPVSFINFNGVYEISKLH
jgi:hypothetical protein